MKDKLRKHPTVLVVCALLFIMAAALLVADSVIWSSPFEAIDGRMKLCTVNAVDESPGICYLTVSDLDDPQVDDQVYLITAEDAETGYLSLPPPLPFILPPGLFSYPEPEEGDQ